MRVRMGMVIPTLFICPYPKTQAITHKKKWNKNLTPRKYSDMGFTVAPALTFHYI